MIGRPILDRAVTQLQQLVGTIQSCTENTKRTRSLPTSRSNVVMHSSTRMTCDEIKVRSTDMWSIAA